MMFYSITRLSAKAIIKGIIHSVKRFCKHFLSYVEHKMLQNVWLLNISESGFRHHKMTVCDLFTIFQQITAVLIYRCWSYN